MKQKSLLKKSRSFKHQTKKDWLKNVDLGAIKEKNIHNCYDPIYFQEEIKVNNTFEKFINWDIYVEIIVNDEKVANKKALEFLSFGVNSICFINIDKHNLDILFKDIQIDIINIHFKHFSSIEYIVQSLVQFSKKNQIDHTKLKGHFDSKSITKKEYIFASSKFPNFTFLSKEIHQNNFKNVTEISKHNFIKTKHIIYIFKMSNCFFFDISKLRSFRISYENKHKQSPYILSIIETNTTFPNSLIETSTKSLSSILGGSNALLVVSKKNYLAYIKQQLILKHESYLDRVSDPTHGSYYIEKVTNSLNQLYSKTTKLKSHQTTKWETAEEIVLKSKYHRKDIENIEHIKYGVGEEPYLRGPYTTMYCDKKWTIRQYSGFSTAKESNTFYKKNLKAGQTGLSIAFDLPTHRGYDSDHPRVFGDVGKAGVAIDSIEDMKELLKGIDLSTTSVSMTMNGAIIPIMAFFIATAETSGFQLNKLTGTIQNDILKEFMVRNTYIYPPKPSMRIVSDIFKYTSINMPKFNNISVSGYHMLEAGASADIELAYTLSDGIEYIKTGINAGLDVDDFAPRLSFFWGIGMNLFMEIAKMRAGRILWSEMMREFKPKNPKSTMLRVHCQTSGWSLTEQDPYNNITRTTIEAIAAIIGGTQSLHTNAFDEAISLPSTYSAKIARDTQIYLQKETDLGEIIDPFGGSYYLEVLTNEIVKKAKKHIKEINSMGGMAQAIEMGMPKLKIETSAIKRQAKIDNNQNLIIGVNCFKANKETKFDILEVNNKKVQISQIKNLKKIKKNRDTIKVKKYLKKLSKACELQDQNLLHIAVQAAKYNATLGEISTACEKVFTRYVAKTNLVSGIYGMERKNDKHFIIAKELSNKFNQIEGRRPRILTAKLGQDGHDRGIKIISTSFSDMGFDVDIAPLFQTPKEIAKQAIENDVHMIGISSLAGGHITLIPDLILELEKMNRPDIMIIAGGVIPKKDYKKLYQFGVQKIFGPGTIVSKAGKEILIELLNR